MGGMSWGALTHVTKVHSKRPARAVSDSICLGQCPIVISHCIESGRAQRLSDYHLSHVPISQANGSIKYIYRGGYGRLSLPFSYPQRTIDPILYNSTIALYILYIV